MAKTGKEQKPGEEAQESKQEAKASKQKSRFDSLKSKLVLKASEIMEMGVEAELLVGGKNFNTA
ncbi:hypothetical protein, partial [Desulfonatronospira sp. MSAO_Bac3]